MTAGSYELVIEVRREDGTWVAETRARPGACVEDALFQSVAAGVLPNDGSTPAARIEPRWHESERPAVTGIRVVLDGQPPRHYARDAFATQARSLIARLLTQGSVAAAENLVWRLIAREAARRASDAPRVRRAPFPLEPADLPGLSPGAFEVRFDAGTLQRLCERVRADGATEGAELLLGRLLHDRLRGALEMRVANAVALAPGRGGRSNTHFSFDPGSFVEARRAASGREDGIRPCGWHHNHNPCEGCLENPECSVDWVFFSADDLEVHSSLFGSPHMIALVGGKVGHLPATRPGFRLYGWRGARVVERSFRVEGPGAEYWSASQGAFLDVEERK